MKRLVLNLSTVCVGFLAFSQNTNHYKPKKQTHVAAIVHKNPKSLFLKITILIVDHDQEKLKIWTEEMHKVWEHNQFPASTLIPVPRLALDGMLIEVDAVAFIKK